MNRKYDIIRFAAFLLLAAGCFHSCSQSDSDDFTPDGPQSLIASGRYLSSAVVAANGAREPEFEAGTPYRLLAFTKPYKADGTNKTDLAEYPRFNKVAWEGATPGGLRYINIKSDPDKWFGFSAIGDELKGDNGLVSLDFYGFTYGRAVENPKSEDNYIALDGVSGETVPGTALSSLKRTETAADVTDAGGTVLAKAELNDLMRGALPNQNISTVGHSGSGTQSILPFKHCFSKLRFKAFQQKDDAGDPCFENIVVTKVALTNTFTKGAAYLQSGKVEIDPEQIALTQDNALRRRELKLTSMEPVATKEVVIGEMIVFPSDGNDLKNSELAEGYDVGLEITVTGSETDIKNFLRNNTADGSTDGATQGADGRWSCTIRKDRIIDYTDPTVKDKSLRFRQNTIYTLVLWFVKDAVRIITVVPQVEPWVDGEVSADGDPWEEQALGQPQMFDNVVWSDRNIGAVNVKPTDGMTFEQSVGYFYQAGRNIPYYPFHKNNYPDFDKDGIPDFNELNGQKFVDQNTDWGQSAFRFYPIVDKRICKMYPYGWIMQRTDNNVVFPQLRIPEQMPTDSCFNFLAAKNSVTSSGLSAEENMYWDRGSYNQPVDGLWRVPTDLEFLTIFPSTPHAGNIVFNKVGHKGGDANNWGCDGDAHEPDFQMPKAADGGTDVLRVTVPYYTRKMARPTGGRNGFYNDAWKILDSHNDQGTTHLEQYVYNEYNGNPGSYTQFEPDGDPAPGFASTYIISRAGDDAVGLQSPALKERLVVKEWGTIYAIKRVYTAQAYRMRWRANIVKEGTMNPCICIEISRYRCNETDSLTEENYMKYDWDHPAARIYFPVGGMGDWDGDYINFGMECAYATSDPIKNDGTVNALRLKITGNNASNAYMAVVKERTNRNFGMQIRPVMRGGEFDTK